MDNGADSYLRFLDGDGDAFAALVERYGLNLILFINGFIGNASVSEELMEDTFCDLYIKKSRFSGRSSFKTYLFAIAHNKAMTYLRKNARFTSLPDDISLTDSVTIEGEVFKNDDRERLYRAMSRINPDYRVVLHLLYFEDMSYEQAARVLKKNKKQISNLAHRAKNSLRTELEKGGYVNENLS